MPMFGYDIGNIKHLLLSLQGLIVHGWTFKSTGSPETATDPFSIARCLSSETVEQLKVKYSYRTRSKTQVPTFTHALNQRCTNLKTGRKVVKSRRKPVSHSKRAGLLFPVGRIHRYLKNRIRTNGRVFATAAVYSSAILEYLTAEVLELSGNVCKQFKVKRITPHHILLAIKGDKEMASFIKATIAGGGVVPHINKELLRKKGQQEFS
ncbi:histone H2A.V-like [Bombina bombina]|uniref:histone H2A.V-like n=1 Tax=Bombina bombina TaxID=8345 RepID=UPI00235AF0FD|nr:histone H2A.V-like [Bombina bombina]